MPTKFELRTRLLGDLPKGMTIAEIGTWKGDFSDAILNITVPKRLYLIDPWRLNADPAYDDALYGSRKNVDMEAVYRQVAARFGAAVNAGRVKIIRGTASDAMSEIGRGELDCIYIDGDHTYDGVKKDLAFADYAVKKGGLICGDDYTLGGWWKDGVIKAVNEYIGSHGSNRLVEMMAWGQFVLRKMSD